MEWVLAIALVLLLAAIVAVVIDDHLKVKNTDEPIQMESGRSHLRD